MLLEQRADTMMAASLACLAGYNDAVGFRALGGVFVSFMSGNSTRFAVDVSQPDWSPSTFLPLGIIALFLFGVIAGALVREKIPRRKQVGVLTLVTAVIGISAVVATNGQGEPAAALLAVAMGASNNVFVKQGEVSVALTYMTGTLVKLGQRLAGRACGSRKPWLSNLILWLAFILGAVAGSLSHSLLRMQALWISFAFAACLLCIDYVTSRVRGRA